MNATLPETIQTPSGTSTIGTQYSSSSSQPPLVQAVTAARLSPIHPQPINDTSGFNIFFEKWGVPLGGMVMTGIIGYYSAIIPLKDAINENKTEVSIAKKEIENLQEKIKQMEDNVDDISQINTQIAVINEKLTHTKEK